MAGSYGDTIPVGRLIDDAGIAPIQIVAISLCALVALLDGLDSMSIAVGAPAIVDQLKLPHATLGPIFSSAFLGGMIGALTFGPLGDRFGRKRILVAATVLFGVFIATTAYVQSYEALLAARFASGLGLGGATPCFIALASEYAPRRRRAMIASLIWSAFPLGGAIGGFVNAYILNYWGWQAIFVFGGLLPLAVAAVLFVWLPESIRFLIASSGDPARIAAIVAKIHPGLPPGARFAADETRTEGTPLNQLFAEGRAIPTKPLWAPFFTAFATLALVVF